LRIDAGLVLGLRVGAVGHKYADRLIGVHLTLMSPLDSSPGNVGGDYAEMKRIGRNAAEFLSKRIRLLRTAEHQTTDRGVCPQ